MAKITKLHINKSNLNIIIIPTDVALCSKYPKYLLNNSPTKEIPMIPPIPTNKKTYNFLFKLKYYKKISSKIKYANPIIADKWNNEAIIIAIANFQYLPSLIKLVAKKTIDAAINCRNPFNENGKNKM